MGRHSVPDPEDSGTPDDGGQPGAGRPGEYSPGAPRYYDEEDDGPAGPPRYAAGPQSGYGTGDYVDTGYFDDGDDDEYADDEYDDYPDSDDADGRVADTHEDADYDAEAGDGYYAPGGDTARPGPGEWQSDSGQDFGYLGDRDAETRAFATSTPPPANRRDWDNSEWTGSHRAVAPKRRGLSVSVIVALVSVVVVVAAVIAWRFFGSALSDRREAAAARCVAGEVAVSVVADPSIAEQLTPLAEKYNSSADPVGDKCVKIGITAADSDQVINGFAGQWPGDLGERPALWIPGSSVSEARLEAATGPGTVSDSRSLVTSPVMLAIRPQMKNALAQQNWSTLPALQSNPTSLDGLNLSGWGSLRLALPLADDSDATYLAAEAVASAAAPRGAPVTSGSGAISSLMAGQPKLADDKASTAMDALVGSGGAAAGQVHAVVTTEQQIYQAGTARPNAKDQLASWLPPGPTAVADYPTVLLAGQWLSQEQLGAASEFARFLRKPESLAELAKAGFRYDGATLPQSDVTSFGPIQAPLSVGDNAMRATLANLVSAPAQSPAVTILLDQSMTTDEGGKSRLANTTAALGARLQALPPNSAVGLWTFDGVSGRSEVAMGPLDEPVGGQPRETALTDNLNGQAASDGGAVSFTTLRLMYPDAVSNFREGQPNSVLVITSGPHTDQSLDGPGLQEFIRANFSQARPVAVNVIDFGGDPDRATWEAVAQTTGGDYQNLNSSAGPELVTALTNALG